MRAIKERISTYVPAYITAGIFLGSYRAGMAVPVLVVAACAAALFIAAMEAERVLHNGHGRAGDVGRYGIAVLVLIAFSCLAIVYRVGPATIIDGAAGHWLIGGSYHVATGPVVLVILVYLAGVEYWLSRILARALPPTSRTRSRRFAQLALPPLAFKGVGFAVASLAGFGALWVPAYVQLVFPVVYWLAAAGYLIAAGYFFVRLWTESETMPRARTGAAVA